MGYKKLQLESYFPDEEITRYGFISHMESYIKQLLNSPETASVDDYLMRFGIDSPKALCALLKRTDPSDETSAVLIRKESIKPDEDDGVTVPKDKFHIKYKLPRKDYMKKMRNLYISLFENHIININSLNEVNANDLKGLSKVKEKKNGDEITFSFGKNGWGLSDEITKLGKKISKLSQNNNVYLSDSNIDTLDDVYDLTFKVKPIEEGAWGKGILDNDLALDYQSEFGIDILNKFITDVEKSYNSQCLWGRLGVMIDFLKKYKDDELKLTDEYTSAIMFARRKIDELYRDKSFINAWENPKEMEAKLKKLDRQLSDFLYEKNILNVSQQPTFEYKINEDGEGGTMAGMGGATTCDASSGQFIQPLSAPIKRKTVYLTQEQVDYLKEEAEMDTAFGDFGYDVPAFNDKKDPTLDHKNMMKKSFEGK